MIEQSKYIRAEVSASAVAHNIALCRELVGPAVKVFTLIKARCYGHGQAELLPILEQHADGCIAAAPSEALEARQLGYAGPLLLLFASGCEAFGGAQLDVVAELIRRDVVLTATTIGEVEAIAAVAAGLGKKADVHVMVDSGMTRSGARPELAAGVVDAVRASGSLNLAGIYTHMATADEADKDFANQQLDTFDAVLGRCDIDENSGVMRHAANSPGTIELPRCHYDMVRFGQSLFGSHSSFEMHNRLDLKPVLRLVSFVMQKKAVPAGAKVGYGCSHVCQRDSILGLVPIGYGDGYLRDFSNRASMQVNGQSVPVIGRVSMDQTIIDLTDVPQANIGDEVVIISDNPADANSVENLAEIGNTIPQVVTSHLSAGRIQRVVVE